MSRQGRMTIRQATPKDIPFVVEQESRADYRHYIQHWSFEQHAEALHNPDLRYHLIVGSDGGRLGYTIHTGLLSPHRSIYLQRLVVVEPGQGVGRLLLMRLMEIAFEQWGAHRYWLHVFSENARARALYRSLEFQEEGQHRDAILLYGVFKSPISMAVLEDEWWANLHAQIDPKTFPSIA
ncbi:MAG: GNAT family N-acetyltransferase [Magnetococcales bacterium]|nr:GNAT family N-acetyltransferase [Magnetococcales bacterium]